MAFVSRSSSTWLLSLKVALISIGVVSMAVILRQSIPVISEFSVSGVPVMWSSFRSWLKPPYLYVIINGIIITIAASSKFHRMNHQDQPETAAKDPEDERTEFTYEMKNPPEFVGLETPIVYEQREVTISEVKNVADSPVVEDEEELVISRSTTPPLPPSPLLRRESSEIPLECLLSTEKPLVSSRFGHRKPIKASPEGGKVLRVSKPKRHETLENTWKMITDGRHMPLTRHLKKSDTWENHGRHIVVREDTSPQRVNKSETFKDRTNNPPPSLTSPLDSVKLRKDPSLSQDELNRRVEAFIKKFNEEMRLQRQESLNQYKEMISRGAQ